MLAKLFDVEYILELVLALSVSKCVSDKRGRCFELFSNILRIYSVNRSLTRHCKG